MRLIRGDLESVSSYLHRIYNDYGCIDLALTMSVTVNGDVRWSSKVRYDYVMSLADWEYVRGTFYRRYHRPYQKREFMYNVRHRTILDIEIMLDVDDVSHPFIDFNSIEEKSRWVYYSLLRDGYKPVVYFTGSKSYHISVLDLRLRSMSRGQRQRLRERVISKYNCDLGLVSDIRTVALEGQEHYRSGKKKELVMSW